jgi:hypothetical protein
MRLRPYVSVLEAQRMISPFSNFTRDGTLFEAAPVWDS